jgi:hypothetical protein
MRTRFLLVFALGVACGSCLAAENPLTGMLSGENLKKLQATGVELRAGPKPDSVVLKFPASDTAGTLVIPVPEAARDWTHSGAFTFDFTSTSTIKWQLVIRNGKGETFGLTVAPYQDVPVRAAVSSAYLQREYMNNRAYKAHWLSVWSNHIDLSRVESLTVRMTPNRDVTLTLGPLALTEQDAPDEFFIDKPVVDQFGQWIPAEWPGKPHSLDELQAAWKAEDAELAKPADYGYCPMGGYLQSPQSRDWSGPPVLRLAYLESRDRSGSLESASGTLPPAQKATGYFRVAEVDGKWWLIDPHGHLFFSAGMDCVRIGDESRVTGREKLFEKLPALRPTGRAGAAGEMAVNFGLANALLRYGASDTLQAWKAKQIQRLRAWGFNTVANWSDRVMYENPGMPFVTNVSIGRGTRNWQGFPDVYSAAFAERAERDAQAQCGPFRNEPLLIGYFIGNEPQWQNRNLIELIVNDSTPSDTQAFVKRFLGEKGESAEGRALLLETLARRYHQGVVDAIRKADPNHLILGIRYAGNAPEPILRANDVFDVFSINIYRFEPPADQIQRVYSVLKKPILIGEFHFGAAERGYGPSLVLVRDQKERGVAYQYYVEHAAALAPVIGAHYFQYYDQPVTGRFDGENYNLGFVNVQDIPYAPLVSFAQATHKRLYQVHAGKLKPSEQKAVVR